MKTFSKFLLFVAIAGAPLSTAACHQFSGTAEWSSTGSSVPFELFRGNRVVTQGAVNGRHTDMLLDTGAGITTFDRAFARSIGLPAGRKIEVQGAGGLAEGELVGGVNIDIGSLKLRDATVLVLDLSAIAQGIGRPVPVILGRELFDRAVISLDWDAGQMVITDPKHFSPPQGAREIQLGREHDHLNTIPLTLPGLGRANAHLDLGSGAVVIVPKRMWQDQSALAGLPYADGEAGGVGGLHPTRLVTVPNFEFGGVNFHDVPVTLSEAKHRGGVDELNAGIGLLRQFNVTLALSNDRIYLEPLTSPPPFLRDRAGLRADLVDGGLKVNFVSRQGPAAKAGIKLGDLIVAVNSQKVASGFFNTPMGDWSRRSAGTPVSLTLADGREVKFALADYY